MSSYTLHFIKQDSNQLLLFLVDGFHLPQLRLSKLTFLLILETLVTIN